MTDRVRFDWKAWIEWTGLTMVGVDLALIVFCVVANNYLAETWKGGIVTVGVAATLYATMQWIWLRRRMSHALWWIPATVLGWYLAEGLFLLSTVALRKSDPKNADELTSWNWVVLAIVFCLCMTGLSLPQWFLMRRQFQRSSYWIVARPLAWLVGLGFAFLGFHFRVVDGLFQPEYVFGRYVGAMVAWSAAGALFGFGFAAITGATMVWIQTRPMQGQGTS